MMFHVEQHRRPTNLDASFHTMHSRWRVPQRSCNSLEFVPRGTFWSALGQNWSKFWSASHFRLLTLDLNHTNHANKTRTCPTPFIWTAR